MELSEEKRTEIAAVNCIRVPIFTARDIQDLIEAHPQAEPVDLIRQEVILVAQKLEITVERIRSLATIDKGFSIEAATKLCEYRDVPLSPLGLLHALVESNGQWQITDAPPYIALAQHRVLPSSQDGAFPYERIPTAFPSSKSATRTKPSHERKCKTRAVDINPLESSVALKQCSKSSSESHRITKGRWSRAIRKRNSNTTRPFLSVPVTKRYVRIEKWILKVRKRDRQASIGRTGFKVYR